MSGSDRIREEIAALFDGAETDLADLAEKVVLLVEQAGDQAYDDGHEDGMDEGRAEAEEARGDFDAGYVSQEIQRIWRAYGPENERLCEWWRTFEEPWASIAKVLDLQ